MIHLDRKKKNTRLGKVNEGNGSRGEFLWGLKMKGTRLVTSEKKKSSHEAFWRRDGWAMVPEGHGGARCGG